MNRNENVDWNVLDQLADRKISVCDAAIILGLSERQVLRKKKDFILNDRTVRDHGNKGRKPHNAFSEYEKKEILDICSLQLNGYNHSHACDVLHDEFGHDISRPTLDRWLRGEKVASPKMKKRQRKHKSRKSRAREGELAQMDASQFDWLSDGSVLHLHGAVDDATGKPLALFFDTQETRNGYVQCMLQMNENGTLPASIYTDGRTVFVSGRKDVTLTKAEEMAGIAFKETSFLRGLRDLGIIHLLAHSPQAKGAIERLWGTLQDRLPKDLARRGITDIRSANEYLKEYVTYLQNRFSVPARNPEKAYVPSVSRDRIETFLSRREFRITDNGLSVCVDGKRYTFPDEVIKKVPITSHQSIEIAINETFGCRALLKRYNIISPMIPYESNTTITEKVYTQEEISEIRRKAGLKGKSVSPWRKGLPPVRISPGELS